jgi:hypothetical protein
LEFKPVALINSSIDIGRPDEYKAASILATVSFSGRLSLKFTPF